MATTDQLRDACKTGLNIQLTETAFDAVIDQKTALVKGFMIGAGISQAILDSDLATPIIVLGVGDTWSLEAGELKFSPVFLMLLGQLAAKSSVLTVATDPAAGAADVPVDVKPVLTFSRALACHRVALKTYDDQADVLVITSLDITGKVITVAPGANLVGGTKYALIIEATAVGGPSLSRTVVGFTTAQG